MIVKMPHMLKYGCNCLILVQGIAAVLRRSTSFAFALMLISTFVSADDPLPAGAIEARNVFLQIKDSADLPASEDS